jgi:hypothetical protein
MSHQTVSKDPARRTAIAAGIFFIAASTSAIIGLSLYVPVLNSSHGLAAGSLSANQVLLGVVFELILACSNIGTAITLFPFLQRHNKVMGVGYVAFRALEVVFILIGIMTVLSLLTLSRKFVSASSPDMESFRTAHTVLRSVYYWAFLLGPNFMLGVNSFLYSVVFYRSGLVPKNLAGMGVAGAVLIFLAAILQIFGVVQQLSAMHFLMSLPIALYEMILAGWLIVKGFNTDSAKQRRQPMLVADLQC